ncbi:MAG: chromate transporter [Lachnospiraceae bacterium]|nr:chromate transporter [Lachnospiraceae bacterium]
MRYLELFITFLKIGAFTFGGGYAMLPLIQEQVAAHGWLTDEELINFIAVSESTPGPFAINISTYVGMETGGLPGAFCATLGVVMPSFIIILIVAKCFGRFQESRVMKGAMSGLKPAVVGLIAAAVVSTGKTVLFPNGLSLFSLSASSFIISILIFVLMFILILQKIHPIFIIILSGIIGVVTGYLPQIVRNCALF